VVLYAIPAASNPNAQGAMAIKGDALKFSAVASAAWLLTGCGLISEQQSNFRTQRETLIGALVQEKHYDEALAEVDKAAQFDWTHYEWYRLRSEINCARKHWTEAVADADAAHSYAPSSIKYWMLEQRAAAHEGMGNVKAAIKDCTNALEELPSMEENLHSDDEAIILLERRAKLQHAAGNYAEEQKDLASVGERRKTMQDKQASAYSASRARLVSSPDTARALNEVLALKNPFDENQVKTIISAINGPDVVRGFRQVLLYPSGELDLAIDEQLKVSLADIRVGKRVEFPPPEYQRDIYEYPWGYLELVQYNGLVQHAFLRSKAAQYHQAADRCAEVAQGEVDVHPKRAIDLLNKAIEYEDAAYLHGLRARAYANLKKYQQAIEDHNTLIKMEPRSASYVSRAQTLYSARRLPEAAADLDRAIAIGDRWTSYVLRSQVYMDLGRYHDALSDLEHVLGTNTNRGELFVLRARARIGAKQRNEAISDLKQAVSCFQENADINQRDQAIALIRTIESGNGSIESPPVFY
jgi:tetratricopeptide (TPR) repeat protein